MSTKRRTIVAVDDERQLLMHIKSILTPEGKYCILTFSSLRRALRYIVDNDVDLVISDLKMPTMTGIDFLRLVKKNKPDVPCVLLTFIEDKHKVVKAINNIGLFQYLKRPINKDDLLIIVRNAVEKMVLKKRLKEKIEELKSQCKEVNLLEREILKVFV